MSWLRRLVNTVRRGAFDSEIDRELSFHLAERVDQLRAEGMSEREAIRRARLQLGNPLVQRERTREMNVAVWFETVARDVRHACRGMARTPGFTLIVIGTLALGMGANTAMFSAVDAVVLQPLPFPDADRLVKLTQITDRGEVGTAAVRLEDWDRRSTAFLAITSHVSEDVSDTTGPDPERVHRVTVGPHGRSVLCNCRSAPAFVRFP